MGGGLLTRRHGTIYEVVQELYHQQYRPQNPLLRRSFSNCPSYWNWKRHCKRKGFCRFSSAIRDMHLPVVSQAEVQAARERAEQQDLLTAHFQGLHHI